jgi:hypothetical protein
MTKTIPKIRDQSSFFIDGARRRTCLTKRLPLTTTISSNKAFVRFDVRLRRWLLPPLVRIKTPAPVSLNRLDVALWVFNFTFPSFCLRGTENLLSNRL